MLIIETEKIGRNDVKAYATKKKLTTTDKFVIRKTACLPNRRVMQK